MKIEYVTIIHLIFLSFLIVMIVGRLSNNIFAQMFIKGYVKQIRKQKIFFFESLKYPILLSASFITLQLQLANLQFPREDIFFMIPSSMIFYTALKALYMGNVGNKDACYFVFVSSLDGFFFDLLVIMTIFILGDSFDSSMWWIFSLFFIGNVFFKISSSQATRNNAGRYVRQWKEDAVIDQFVFNLAEYTYIISLLFFATSRVVAQGFGVSGKEEGLLFGYYLNILISVVLIIIVINVMYWILKWSIRKKTLDRQIIQVKYMLAPFFLLALAMQFWKINEP